MFKIDIQHITRPYIHIMFNVCVDTLCEAELMAVSMIMKHFTSYNIELVYDKDLEYKIYDSCEYVGDVTIKMLD